MALETINRKTGAVVPEPMTTVYYVVHRPENGIFPMPVLSGPYVHVESARSAADAAKRDLATIHGRLATVDVAHVNVPVSRRLTKLAQVGHYVLTDSKRRTWGQLP